MPAPESTHFSVRCPACRAMLRLPAAAAGKKAKCPACGVVFPVRSEVGADQEQRARERAVAAGAALTLRCPQCAARLKVPAKAAGRSVKCPKCQTALQVPAVSTPLEDEILDLDDKDLLGVLSVAEQRAPSAEDGGTVPVAPVKPRAGAGARPLVGGRTCPSCHQALPGDAKICVRCGIYLDSGRSILATEEEHLDSAYSIAEQTIRWVSWIIWFGVYPVASEAFGLRKPWVVRGIAILTIVVSLVFLAFEWTEAPGWDSARNLMLWTGNPQAGQALLAEVDKVLDLDEIEDAEVREAIRREAGAALAEHLASAKSFHAYQLVTHAFLHGGVLHLAGNMLFLMVLGARVNALIGTLWTIALYPVLAVIAGAAEAIAAAHGPPIPMLGASGAVMGLAGMYLVLFPVHKVHMAIWFRWGLLWGFRLWEKFFAVRGFWVVLFYIAFDVAYTVFRLEDDVAHWAHLGGFIGGAVIALTLLMSRLIDARGGDILSVVLGRHAWALVGRPGR